MKRLLTVAVAPIAWLLLTAGSCATTQGPEPQISPKIVEVPIPTPCKPTLGAEPAYPDTDDALAGVTDVFSGTQLLKAGRTLRIARLSELGAALKGCESAQ